MSFIDKLLVRVYSKKVGEDEFGNEYFVSFLKNYLGHNKRLVIYKGVGLASKVPPMWHAWLHYMSDETPISNKKLQWQKRYQPNLTGTKYAYDPSELTNKTPIYSEWNPNN